MCHGQLLNDTLRKARKEHRCWDCSRPIKAGRLYNREVQAKDGELLTFKLCERCNVARLDLIDDGACYSPGYLRDSLEFKMQDMGKGFRAWLRERIEAARRAAKEAR